MADGLKEETCQEQWDIKPDVRRLKKLLRTVYDLEWSALQCMLFLPRIGKDRQLK